jgi:hypothetical protein
MEQDDFLIPFIHNYCDRWCERCEFTNRCGVFAMESEMYSSGNSLAGDSLAQNLKRILDDAHKMLSDKFVEFEIELNEADLEEFRKQDAKKRQKVRADSLAVMAKEYGMGIMSIVENRTTIISPKNNDPLIDDVFAVIQWYQFFITAKTERALSGIIDDDGDEDWDELHDAQSDANGSAKLALMAAERSILAWTYLLESANADVLKPILQKLESIRVGLAEKFPLARDFIRPGFDEIEIVM